MPAPDSIKRLVYYFVLTPEEIMIVEGEKYKKM
jgi:hypothetical protein